MSTCRVSKRMRREISRLAFGVDSHIGPIHSIVRLLEGGAVLELNHSKAAHPTHVTALFFEVMKPQSA